MHKIGQLRRRSKVVEILAAREFIFTLTSAGVCTVFDGRTHERLCYMNQRDNEVIRSLYHNKVNDSIMTVSVYREDEFSALRSRTTALEYLRRGRLDQGYELFESEKLHWPGFIEFDDANGKIITFSADTHTYKVWEQRDYSFLYAIKDPNICEIKPGPGMLLVIYRRRSGYVPFSLVDIETGTIVRTFNVWLHRSRKVEITEITNEKVIIKQEGEAANIFDIRTGKSSVISSSDLSLPAAFIFLSNSHLFLTFKGNTVIVWNEAGEQVSKFEDHKISAQTMKTNCIFVSANKGIIFSHSQSPTDGSGAIVISSIFSGKTVGRITSPDNPAALEDVTSLYYSDERGEIYTGNKNGELRVWSV